MRDSLFQSDTCKGKISTRLIPYTTSSASIMDLCRSLGTTVRNKRVLIYDIKRLKISQSRT